MRIAHATAALVGIALSSGCGSNNTHAGAASSTSSAGAKNGAAPEASATASSAPSPETSAYALTEGSKRLVCKTMTSDVIIQAFVTRGSAQRNAFVDKLTQVLKAYESARYVGTGENAQPKEYKSHIRLSVLDASTPDAKETAKDAGLVEQTFADEVEGSKDSAVLTRGYSGLVMKYGVEQEVIPALPENDGSGLEFMITNKLRALSAEVSGKKTRIGVLAGKGEIKLTDNNLAPTKPGQVFNIKAVFEQYMSVYEFVGVDLHGGDAEIDRELPAIMVTQPGKDYSEKELRRIDEFLMRGNKSMVVFASAVNLKASDRSMRATLSTHGIDRLLDGYGVEMKKDLVFDSSGCSRMEVTVASQSQKVPVSFPWALFIEPDDRFVGERRLLDDSFVPFFRMNREALPFASSLIVHREKQPSIRLRVVARTTPDAVTTSDASIDVLSTSKNVPKGEKAQRDVAVAIEPGCCDGRAQCSDDDPCKKGSLQSAFPSGDKMGVDAPAESRGPARVLVISSAQFLANPFARSGNPPDAPTQPPATAESGGDSELQMVARPYYEQTLAPSLLTLKNTLDWMTGDEDMVSLSETLGSSATNKAGASH